MRRKLENSPTQCAGRKDYLAVSITANRCSLESVLFNDLLDRFQDKEYTDSKGQIVDTRLINAPVQRNSREENAQIKQCV